MGQISHGRAATTAAVRRAIPHIQESMAALAGRHGINPPHNLVNLGFGTLVAVNSFSGIYRNNNN